jgi:hypothetical protein
VEEPADPLARLRSRHRVALPRLLDGLRDAATDPAIAGLVVKLGGPGLALAQAQEVADAVRVFAGVKSRPWLGGDVRRSLGGDAARQALQSPGEADAALPLPLAGAVVRRVDTPQFRGVTSYEVQARSVLNRVPDAFAGAVPLDGQPLTGCTHACVYWRGQPRQPDMGWTHSMSPGRWKLLHEGAGGPAGSGRSAEPGRTVAGTHPLPGRAVPALAFGTRGTSSRVTA